MPKCKCGKDMILVGFTKDEDGKPNSEEFSCADKDCPNYLDLKRVPWEEET